VRTASSRSSRLLPVAIVLVFAVAAAGCESSGHERRDAAHDGTTDASYWYPDTGPSDGPRPHPDVAPIPGLTVTVDGVPWYVLNGSTSFAPATCMAYLTAMISCDTCTDTATFVISAPGDSAPEAQHWSSHTDQCGPSDDTITFTRTSISSHPWKSPASGNCGFSVSSAGGYDGSGQQIVRFAGSYHGTVTNIDSQVTVTYDLGVDFDLALDDSFP
jgi:hypothetical protein